MVEEEKKEAESNYNSAATAAVATATNNNYSGSNNYRGSDGGPPCDMSMLVRTATSLSSLLSAHHDICLRSATENARQYEMQRAERRREDRVNEDRSYQRRELLSSGRGASTSFKEGGGGGGNSAIVPRPKVISPTLTDRLLPFHSRGVVEYLKSFTTITGDNDARVKTTQLIASLREGIEEYSASFAPTGSGNTNTIRGITNNDSGSIAESMHQYSNGLSLLESIVSGCHASGDSGGYSAAANHNRRSINNNVNNNAIRSDYVTAQHVSSACRFFAHQFQNHMTDVVREIQLNTATATNTNTDYGSSENNAALTSLARDAAIFAEIVLGRQPAIPTSTNNGGGTTTTTNDSVLWGALYYCLRCGDLAAARSVVLSHRTDASAEAAVAELVHLLADVQGGNDTVFAESGDKSLLSPSDSVIKARRAVGDLYEGIKTRFFADGNNNNSSLLSSPSERVTMGYKAACLAMLSGNESVSEASSLESIGLVETVEDYLYASLWHALHSARETSSSSSGSGLKRTCEAVARLGTLVKEWGPSYFEQEDDTSDGTAVSMVAVSSQLGSSQRDVIPRSGGWAYALPLLACQQYGSALGYLAEVGGGLGLMQATHVALIMDAMGIDMADYVITDGNSSSEDGSQLFSMLVSSFSATLQGTDVVSALKYLMLLRGKSKVMNAQVREKN